MVESLTSAGWARIDARLQVAARLARGEAIYIDADEIKSLSGREPRLMTKFDTRESRPPLLAKATVLPVTNGRYVVVAGDGYHALSEVETVKRWALPSYAAALKTLPWSAGPSSESQALDMALAAGVLADFLREERVALTVRGRRRSPRFEFDFQGDGGAARLVADGVQIEVDSGLEGESIHLVEGKLGTRDNFHIRQLYYPMRMWHEEVPTKNVNAVFMTWSNRRFALRRYRFAPRDSYHGIELAAATDYVLDEDEGKPSLGVLLQRAPREPLPTDVPFPQADDMRKVIDVVDAVGKGCRTQERIAALYDFDKRQADYYGNAATFLGLLQRGRGEFSLSATGQALLVSPLDTRHALIVSRLAALPVTRPALEWVAAHRALPGIDAVSAWIEAATSLTGATPRRRALTVLAWARWAAAVTGVPLEGEGAVDGEA